MELGAETTLLLALSTGPGFGLELIERVALRSKGLLRLNHGGAYLALQRLAARGLVHGWTRKLSRSGRPRRYYELTPEGILHAEQLRLSLDGLLRERQSRPTPAETRAMADRVSRSGSLSASVIRLRDAPRRPL